MNKCKNCFEVVHFNPMKIEKKLYQHQLHINTCNNQIALYNVHRNVMHTFYDIHLQFTSCLPIATRCIWCISFEIICPFKQHHQIDIWMYSCIDVSKCLKAFCCSCASNQPIDPNQLYFHVAHFIARSFLSVCNESNATCDANAKCTHVLMLTANLLKAVCIMYIMSILRSCK